MRLRLSIFGKPYYFTFKFFGLTCLLVALFCKLGFWQYHRAQEKRLIIETYAERHDKQLPVYSDLFKDGGDSRFYSVRLSGHFDNQHLVLLDNKTYQGRIGYEIYSPLVISGTKSAILVDRGWIPAERDRHHLPKIQALSGEISLHGVINTPPRFFSLGSMMDGPTPQFPLRVQYIKIDELQPILGLTLAPYVLWLDPADKHGFLRDWKVSLVGPEKHLVYTVQWFAFALSLLVIFGALNLQRVKK